MRKALVLALFLIACSLFIPFWVAKADIDMGDNQDLQDAITSYVECYLDEGLAEYYQVPDVNCNFRELKYDGKDFTAHVFTDYYTLHKASSPSDLPMIQGIMDATGLKIVNADIDSMEASLRATNPEKSDLLLYCAAKIISERVYDAAECMGHYVHNSASFSISGVYDQITGNFEVTEFLVEQEDDKYVKAEVILPESFEVLYNVGKNEFWQVAYNTALAVEKRQALAAQENDKASECKEITYFTEAEMDKPIEMRERFDRLLVRDYANQYTSNPAYCYYCYGTDHLQDTSYYHTSVYTWYHNNDCCNYLSQAVRAGRLSPTAVWKPYTDEWKIVDDFIDYFDYRGWLIDNGYYWANAGGFIDMGGHVVIIVLNDTVNRQFSAHTNDRKQYTYYNNSSWDYYNINL